MTYRDPYYVRLRGLAVGRGQEPDWDDKFKFFGPDETKGIEILAASEQGAVIVRLQGAEGEINVKVSLIPWTRWDGARMGGSAVLYDGPIGIRGQDEQLSMFDRDRLSRSDHD